MRYQQADQAISCKIGRKVKAGIAVADLYTAQIAGKFEHQSAKNARYYCYGIIIHKAECIARFSEKTAQTFNMPVCN